MRIFVMCLFMVPFWTYGQEITWHKGQEHLEIGHKVEILEDPDGFLTFELIESGEYDDLFKPSQDINLNVGYKDSFFWIRFRIENRSSEEIILEVAQAGLPVCDLFYQSESGRVIEKGGYQVSMRDRDENSSFQVFRLPEGRNTYYLRFNSNSEPIPIRLYDQKTFQTRSNYQLYSYGIYIGLMVFVAINSLFFFVSRREKIYLFYCLIVLLYMSYSAAVIDGWIVYFIPNLDLKLLYTTIPTIGVTLQTLYCLYFLEVKKYAHRLYKIVMGIVIYFYIWAMIKFLFEFPIVQPINTLNALISFFVMGYVGVSVGKRGNKMGFYFAIAYFIYFLLVSLQALYINTGSPDYLGGLSHVAYATLIEAFVLSFLLSKRTEWEKTRIETERQLAQEKVLKATQENEKLVEEQNAALEKEVAARTAELQELVKTKDRFFSIVSHDLRGPVSSFEGFSFLVKELVEEGNYKKLKELADHMTRSSTQLSTLLDNLLNWAIDQQGEFPFSPETIQLKILVEEVKNIFDNMAQSKGITLSSDIAPNLKVWGDRNTLMTVLRNLVNNALKFTEKGGQVTIKGINCDEEAEIQVIDSGVGMAKEKMDRIFYNDNKQNAWGTDGEKGIGLGLQLALQFTKLNNGDISVESELGVGSVFKIRIPKSKALEEVQSV